jgi:hypothetical protein
MSGKWWRMAGSNFIRSTRFYFHLIILQAKRIGMLEMSRLHHFSGLAFPVFLVSGLSLLA